MAGPTYWEVHEYNSTGAPVLAFVAGAGGHAAADAHGTTWYVEQEEGWRDGKAMRDTSTERLLGDGEWTGGQWKQSHLVTLSGIWVSPDQEAMFASIRDARNTLGRARRTGRLLAQDSDGRRLFTDVTRGGQTIMQPSSTCTGEWSMSFRVDSGVYLSEDVSSVILSGGGTAATGRAYTGAFPYAYQTGLSAGGGQIFNGGDVPVPFTATIDGPVNEWALLDAATGRVLRSSESIPAGSVGVLDTANRTYYVDGQNRRWALSGSWFSIPPGQQQITFQAGGATAATECTIAYHAEAWAA